MSGSVLVVTMLLAVSWALGHVVNTPRERKGAG
ncbi:hypothetical protein [Kribbella pratensis]